jgi:hypothetical protein
MIASRKIFRMNEEPVKHGPCELHPIRSGGVLCRWFCVREIGSPGSHLCLAVRMPRVSRQKSVGCQDRFVARPIR